MGDGEEEEGDGDDNMNNGATARNTDLIPSFNGGGGPRRVEHLDFLHSINITHQVQ